MCRAGGRRCDKKWDDTHRERYNARRRVTRNSSKADQARAEGDLESASVYDALSADAAEEERRYDEQITQHEEETRLRADSIATTPLPAGTRTSQRGQFVLDDAPLALARDRKAIRSILAEGGMSQGEADIHANDCDTWAGKLRHPRVALIRDVQGRTVGSLVYDDGAGRYDDVDIHNVRVDGTHRGSGAGSALIDHVKDVARHGRDRPRGLSVYNMLGSAKSFYARNGGDVKEHSSVARFDLDPNSGRCPNCGQWANAQHQCQTASTESGEEPTGFTSSVARDEDGLITVYHGSDAEIDTFDPAFTGTGNDTWGSGFYFTDDESQANTYGEHVNAVHLNITNPIRVDGADSAHLDDVMSFDAEQSAQILRAHPHIYCQPGDDENTNPLSDYAPDFWDQDEWSREELNAMIDQTAKDYFDDAPWSRVEEMFPGESSQRFRDAVQEVTGHDGVVVDFGDDGKFWIAFRNDQVSAANATEPQRCPDCGQFAGPDHQCSAPGPDPEELGAWRHNLTDEEREARSDYRSILHMDLNEKLRAAGGRVPADLDEDERAMVAHLDSALAKAPRAEQPYTVYRGMQAPKGMEGQGWVRANAEVGSTLDLHGYTSTTRDPSQAEYFAGVASDTVESGVLFEIETTQGAQWGGSGPEKEVTLARGSSFEVVSVDPDHQVNGKSYPKVALREVTRCPKCGQFASSGHTCRTDELDVPERWEMHTERWRKSQIDQTRDIAGGYTMHVTPGDTSDGDGQFWNMYVTKDDQVVATNFFGYFDDQAGETIECAPHVTGTARRRGIATAMYQWAEEVSGRPAAPADRHSEDADGLWGQENRPFGHAKSALSGGGGRHPLAVAEAEPVEFSFVRNTQSLSGNAAAGHDFGQAVEPAGRYMTDGSAYASAPEGWESGTVRFEQPLHMEFGESGLYSEPDNWKNRLSAHYGGKSGAALSQAIRDEGYDAIITRDKYGTSEVVDLTSYSPREPGA